MRYFNPDDFFAMSEATQNTVLDWIKNEGINPAGVSLIESLPDNKLAISGFIVEAGSENELLSSQDLVVLKVTEDTFPWDVLGKDSSTQVAKP